MSSFAQKNYLLVSGYVSFTDNTTIYLSGDIPDGFKNKYNQGAPGHEITLGELLNNLVGEGFVIEKFSGGNGSYVNLLLSRSATNEDDAISIVHNDDGDVREVARYNLQGMQVNENTKGIQIYYCPLKLTKSLITYPQCRLTSVADVFSKK